MLTEENFEAEVFRAKGSIIIDFYADWCAPCRLMDPEFKIIAAEYAGRARFAKVNVDEHKKLAIRQGVLGVPTLLFFKDGDETGRVSGPINAVQLKGRVDALL
jgi:thioredoxin 1